MTLAEAKIVCRSYGFSLNRTGYGAEVRLYPVGCRNPDAGYHTECLDDACGTARLMFKAHGPGGGMG